MNMYFAMVSPQAWGIGVVVLLIVTGYLYFSKKAKLQGDLPEETDKQKALRKKEDQAKWSEIFDDIQEYHNDFPDVG